MTLPRSDQKVVLTWNRDPSIVNVAFKPLTQIRNKTVSHLLGKRAEPPREGQGLGPAREELAQVGVARCPMLKTDLDVTKTGVCRKLPKLAGMCSAKSPGWRRPWLPARKKRERNPSTPHQTDCRSNGPHTLRRKPSAGSENPTHFPHGGGTIGKELQPLLAEHHVEAAHPRTAER